LFFPLKKKKKEKNPTKENPLFVASNVLNETNKQKNICVLPDSFGAVSFHFLK